MRRIRPTVVILTVALAFHLAWYALMWVRLAEDPGGFASTDFRALYTAGRLARSGHLADIYNLDLQHQFQQEFFQVKFNQDALLTFNHPPFLIPLQALLFSKNLAVSYWLWVLLLGLFLVGGIVPVTQWLLSRGWKGSQAVIVAVGWLLFYPVFLSLLKGQDSALLLLGGAFWFIGFMKGKDRLAGIGLALMLIRPHIALMLAIPTLTKNRRVWWWFCLGAAILGLYSFAMLGWQGVQEFIQLLLVSARGSGYGLSPSEMYNFIGILHRIFPGAEEKILNLAAWASYLLALILVCIFWAKSKQVGLRQLLPTLAVCVFAVPHLHYHDLGLLLIPLLGVMVDSVERGFVAPAWSMLIPLLTSFVMILAELSFLATWVPYLILLIIALWPWLAEHIYSAAPGRRVKVIEG